MTSFPLARILHRHSPSKLRRASQMTVDGFSQHRSMLMAQVQLFPAEPASKAAITGARLHPPLPGANSGFGPRCLPGTPSRDRDRERAQPLSWKKLLSHCSRLGHYLLAETEGRTRAGRRALLMSLVSEWMKLRAPSPEKGGEGESRSVSSADILQLGQAMLTGG